MGILGYLGLAIIIFSVVRFIVAVWKEKHNGN